MHANLQRTQLRSPFLVLLGVWPACGYICGDHTRAVDHPPQTVAGSQGKHGARIGQNCRRDDSCQYGERIVRHKLSLHAAPGYWGYCLMELTLSPRKCTKIVLSGGCP